VRVYSSAEEDIHRALLASVAQRPTRRSGVKGVRTKATVVAPNARRIQAVSRTVKSQRPRPDVGSTRAITRAARSDNEVSSSIPLPVLVSAVGGAVLVTAGAASALRRRLSR
jgi:hypothetical protein